MRGRDTHLVPEAGPMKEPGWEEPHLAEVFEPEHGGWQVKPAGHRRPAQCPLLACSPTLPCPVPSLSPGWGQASPRPTPAPA